MNLSSVTDRTDKDLVETFKNGDESAFDELVMRHKGWILARAYRMSGSYHEAEDWAQEVFVKLYQKIGQYRGEVDFSRWLSKLSTRVFIDALRWKKARDWLSFLPQEKMPEEMDREEPEAVKILREAMRVLSPSDHALITLLELEDRAVSEVAAMLNLSESNVKTRAYRARKKLEQALSK